MRYKTRRVYEWSDEIAYTVGLMASDGCLSNDGRHLTLVSADIDQLQNFVAAMGRSLPISKHDSGKNRYTRKQGYRVQFSDVGYYDFLLSIGLTSNKSLTIPALKVPDRYYGHFLRGLFDGDGTTYAYNDPRWPTSYLYYIGFSSASIVFLEYLIKKNRELFGVEGRSIRRSPRVSTLAYGKSDSYKIYRGMYTNAGSLSLARKRDKLESFILHANSGIILDNARVVELVVTLF